MDKGTLSSLKPNSDDTDEEIEQKRQRVRDAIVKLRSKSVMQQRPSPYDMPLAIRRPQKQSVNEKINQTNAAIQDMDLPWNESGSGQTHRINSLNGTVDNLRNTRQTRKFLITDMNQYLDEN